ncbi:hypothetical protein AnigIFM63309_005215 [Aspergillus niger]|nr:hypothetical protein AnigIFM63309_005215 [Aspergillus niger]
MSAPGYYNGPPPPPQANPFGGWLVTKLLDADVSSCVCQRSQSLSSNHTPDLRIVLTRSPHRYPPQGYPPPQGGYPPQGYPQQPYPQQMQYQQQPPPQQKDRGCLGACLATLCCCFLCEESCECCFECIECCEMC